MRPIRMFIATVAIGALSVATAPPAWSGETNPIIVSGNAQCISETEVEVTWYAYNASTSTTYEILGGIVISHGDLAVALSPALLDPTMQATGTSTLPAGPGTATLEVHWIFGPQPASADLRQTFQISQGSAELPDCRQSTTTASPTTTVVESTTTVEQTTTTAQAQTAVPLPQTPNYTG